MATVLEDDPGALRRALLLFDRLFVVNLQEQLLGLRRSPRLCSDIESLASTGVIRDVRDPTKEWREYEESRSLSSPALGPRQRELLDLMEQMRRDRMALQWNLAPEDSADHARKRGTLEAVERELIARLHAAELSSRSDADAVVLRPTAASGDYNVLALDSETLRSLEDPQTEVAILRELGGQSREETVVSVTLEAFPFPHPSVPTYDVVAFRDDADSKRKLLALRVWITQTAKGELSRKEASQLLEHLLLDYENYMKLQHLKYARGVVKMLALAAPSIVTELVTFRISKLLDTIAKVGSRRLLLLEAEATAPGRELAYVTKARTRFLGFRP